MTRIPPEVNLQVRAAILDTFKHDELWNEISFSTGEDLHDQITHLNLTEEVTQLLEFLRVRGSTLQILEHLVNRHPGSEALQAATAAYKAAEEEAKEEAASAPPNALSFTERQPSAATAPQPASFATATPAKQGFQMRPWMWMVVGAVILVVAVGLLVPGDPDTYGDDADLDALWDSCVAEIYASCDSLYQNSPEGSEYEEVGSRCGDPTFVLTEGSCDEILGTGTN